MVPAVLLTDKNAELSRSVLVVDSIQADVANWALGRDFIHGEGRVTRFWLTLSYHISSLSSVTGVYDQPAGNLEVVDPFRVERNEVVANGPEATFAPTMFSMGRSDAARVVSIDGPSSH